MRSSGAGSLRSQAGHARELLKILYAVMFTCAANLLLHCHKDDVVLLNMRYEVNTTNNALMGWEPSKEETKKTRSPTTEKKRNDAHNQALLYSHNEADRGERGPNIY